MHGPQVTDGLVTRLDSRRLAKSNDELHLKSAALLTANQAPTASSTLALTITLNSNPYPYPHPHPHPNPHPIPNPNPNQELNSLINTANAPIFAIDHDYQASLPLPLPLPVTLPLTLL